MRKLIAIILILLSLSAFAAEDPIDLLIQAKATVTTDPEASIELLNSILLLPKNPATEEAQFYIGQAYEKAGKYSKAKIENALFLVEYPKSEYYTQVKYRQIALEIAMPEGIPAAREFQRQPKTGSESSFSGGYSVYASQVGKSEALRLAYFARQGQYSARLAVKASNKHRSDLVYVDLADSFVGYNIRLGKQNAIYGLKHSFTGILAESPTVEKTRIIAATDAKDYTIAVEYNRSYTAYISNNGPGVEIRSFQENVSTTAIVNKDLTLLSSTYYSKNYTLYTLFNRQGNNKMVLFGASKPITQDTSLYIDLQNFKTINLYITNPHIVNMYFTYSKDMQSVTALHSRTFDNFRLDALLRYNHQSLGHSTLTSILRGLYKYSEKVYVESQLSVARKQDATAYIGFRHEF